MVIKNQKGVALVVALVITVVIGVIALALASVTSRTQRSDNSNYGRVLGTSNAVSGVNRAANFLGATSRIPSYDRMEIFNKNIILSTAKEQWVINENYVDTRGFFSGLGQTRPDSQLLANGQPWYRNDTDWTNCPTCVKLNGGTSVYYIEERDTFPAEGSNNPNNQMMYTYYRVTSRGVDGINNPPSASVIQTHVRVRHD